jgi:hypothetical protein
VGGFFKHGMQIHILAMKSVKGQLHSPPISSPGDDDIFGAPQMASDWQ